MPSDVWEDISTLNTLYEELCWDPSLELEFSADYENNRVIIKPKEDK